MQVMRRVHHPNAVQFLGGCTKQEPYLLVTELMSGGSLADAFRSQRVFALRRALEIAVDCARGLAHLHNKKHPSGVVHRDLKPANLMVAGSSYHTRQAFSPLDAVIIVSAWHVSHSCAQMILACAHVTSCWLHRDLWLALHSEILWYLSWHFGSTLKSHSALHSETSAQILPACMYPCLRFHQVAIVAVIVQVAITECSSKFS